MSFPMHPTASHFELRNSRYAIFNIAGFLISVDFTKQESPSRNKTNRTKHQNLFFRPTFFYPYPSKPYIIMS